jgi:predicted ATPase/DNA-binding winged helix-turn-helix (wHTH) protein
MTSPCACTRYRLGPEGRFTLDLDARTLYADGRVLSLGSRALEVLAGLVEGDGATVAKEQLLRRAWPGLVVQEANLHVQVSTLRKLLGSDAIATEQSLGYRWAWPVVRAGSAGARHNLPSERSSFFGREALLQAAQAALMKSRMLSLIGIGGAGKTRLALTLGRQLLESQADGVWWVDLAALDSGDQLPVAVARAIGIVLRDDGDTVDELARALWPRQLILIFDNCEHLLAKVGRLAHAWLDAIPGLRLIATSREALCVDGEWVLPVGPLGFSAPGAGHEEASASESVQLLADRAAKAAPWTALAPIDATILAEICRRVDGIPLAIEIAAAQLRTVSAAQLLGLLEDRFRLLANLAHSLPRQRTMQAVIEWSFDHLQPPEQELLLGLALCSNGCDFDAARALMGPQVPSTTLTAALGRLAEQALMTVQHDMGSPRYRLLETVSQFALDRLGTQPVAARLRERLVAHFLAMVEAHDAQIMERGQGAATLDEVDRERANLLRVLQYCAAAADATAVTNGLRLVGALRHYWVARSQVRLGLDVTQSALRRAEPGRPPDRHLLLARVSEAQLLAELGRLDEAAQAMRHATCVAEAIGDLAHRASTHGYRAGLLDRLGRFDEAAADHEAARRIAAEAGDDRLVADALGRQAGHALRRGQLDDAAALLAQALPLRRRLGHGYRLAVVLINSGAVAARRARWSEARAFLDEAAALLASVGSDALDAALVHHAAPLLQREGCWSALVRGRAAVQHHRENAGLPPDQEDQAEASAQLHDARAALGDEAFEAAWRHGSRLEIALARDRVAAWLQGRDDDGGRSMAGDDA